jgi:NDP-sugar pyrophosphorylase family protein
VKAIILCAGHGSRLGALTAELPKAMLPIGGEPLLSHTLWHLREQGIREVYINTHFRPELIRDFVGDGARFGLRAVLRHEPELLGTAGTVRAFSPELGGEDVLVVYGDLLFDEDLSGLERLHRERAADGTLLVHRRAGSNSLVSLGADGRIQAFLERPSEAERAACHYPWVNSGIALLGPRARAAIPETVPADLPWDLYRPRVAELRLYGFPLRGYRCAIDSPQRYEEALRAWETGACRRPKAR